GCSGFSAEAAVGGGGVRGSSMVNACYANPPSFKTPWSSLADLPPMRRQQPLHLCQWKRIILARSHDAVQPRPVRKPCDRRAVKVFVILLILARPRSRRRGQRKNRDRLLPLRKI